MSANDPALDERIVLVARALTAAEIPFAFGGALAAAYYAEPRATIDIDLNVFVGIERAANVLDAVRPLGVDTGGRTLDRLRAVGQGRLRWDRYLLDVFFSTHPFHDACAARARRVPFGDEVIPILGAEDLVVFKLLFNRTKDWLDIEQILFAQAGRFDIGYVEHWLELLVGAEDAHRLRLAEAVRSASGTDS